VYGFIAQVEFVLQPSREYMFRRLCPAQELAAVKAVSVGVRPIMNDIVRA
jgi:hypothetical protein